MSCTIIEIIYPQPVKPKFSIEKMRNICFGVFLCAAYFCPIINLYAGGKAWSVVVLWSMWFAWTSFLSRPLVENSLISQTARFLLNSCILLILIQVFLSADLVNFVIPIVCFGVLVFLGVIFFMDITKQKQNMMPLLLVIGGSLAVIVCAYIGWLSLNWPTIALGSTAFAMLIASIVILRRQFFLEIKKRFHM